MPIYLGSQPIGEVNVSFTSPDGGTNTNDATLTNAAQLLEGITAYSKGKKITGSIPTKTESNLTANENIVNVPAGYYAAACSKEIATTDLPEPKASVNDTGLVSIVSDLKSGGFLSASQKTHTLQLPTQAAKTIVPTSTEQTAVAAGKYTIGAIKVSPVPSETKKITANGTYTPTNGKWFSSVEVAIVGDTPVYQDKTVNPTTSIQTVLPDDGYDALSQVKVNAILTETKSITENGTFTPSSGKWFSSVSVNVPTGSGTPTLQEKSIMPTKSAQEVVADEGYDGLSKVSISAIPNRYVDTSTATANAADLNSGKTAYVNGSKITGTQIIQHYYTSTSMISNSIGNDGDIFLLTT